MAKPTWITFTPSTGGKKGETTSTDVAAVAAEYTGRVARTGSVTGTTTGGATDTAALSQDGKAEFINLLAGENAKAVVAYDAAGIKCTVQGTANAANLKLASTATVISGVTAKLTVNGAEVAGWNGTDETAVTGDPGADAQYSFIIEFTIPENQSLEERKHILSISNAASVASAQITISQSAGSYSYGDITITAAPTYDDIPAKGGSVSPKGIAYSQTRGWNGRTTGAGTVTSGATVTYHDGSVNGSVIDGGIVTADSKGTDVSHKTSVKTVFFKVALNGKEESGSVVVSQLENAVTKVAAKPMTSYERELSADGNNEYGVSLEDESEDDYFEFTFTSGSTKSITLYDAHDEYGELDRVRAFTASSTAFTVYTVGGDYSVKCPSLGTTVKKETELGYVTYTITGTFTPADGNPGNEIAITQGSSKYCTIKQEANLVTKIALSGQSIAYSKSVPAAGESNVAPTVKMPTVTYTFTSGSTTTSAPDTTYGTYAAGVVTYTAGTAKNGFSTASTTTGVMSATDCGTTVTAARNSDTITATFAGGTYTPAAGYGSSVTAANVTASDYATQVANTASYGDVTITEGSVADIPASGGSVASVTGIAAEQVVSYTSGAKRNLSIGSGLTVAYSATVSKESLARTIKSRSSAGALTATVTGEGDKKATKDYTVYQAENKITAYSEVYVPDYDTEGERTISLGSAGQSYTFKNANAYQIRTYSSGKSDSSAAEYITIAGVNNTSDSASKALEVTTAVKTISAGFSLADTTSTVTVEKNPGTTQRGTFVVTYTVAGNGSKSFVQDINFVQQGSTSTIAFDVDSLSFVAAGETKTLTVTSNDTWTLS